MEESLRRLGPFWAACKKVLERYDLSLDSSLDALRTGLVKQQGDSAQVRLRYPLAARDIDLSVSLIKREGHWYQQQTQDDVQAVLRAVPAASSPAAAAAPDAPAATPAPPASTGKGPGGR